MEVQLKSVPGCDLHRLDEAAMYVLVQLNQIGKGGGDYMLASRSDREVIFRNTGSCSSFCSKKDQCDVRFCNQRQKEIQAGVDFIGKGRLSFTITTCANLSDESCEARINVFN